MGHKNQWSMQVAAKLLGMQAEAASIFRSLGHNGNRGAAREIFIKDFLVPFLPPNVGIGTGEIINHLGERSNQIDIVLYNRGRLSPVLIGTGDLGIFPWECVIATIEVKSSLDAEGVRSSILNAYSVRRVVHALVESELRLSGLRPLDSRPWYFPIPSYVFAFDSDLQTHMETGCFEIGPEGRRLAVQRGALQSQYGGLLRALDQAQKDDDAELISTLNKKLDLYRQTVDIDRTRQATEVGRSDLQGICVLGREWTHGHIQFEDRVFDAYSARPVRTIANFDHYHSSVMGDGSMKEALHFLGHLLLLSNEMPRCFEHYSLDRYLTW